MIEAHNLTRRYGDFTAVDGISLSVREGEILGMLGPNGAGKTTTIRMITGFLPPTSGRVPVDGKDLFEAPREARRQVGYLPENVALYTEMRVREYLDYRAQLEGLSRAEARQAIAVALERCLLGDVRGQIIGTLSKGYRQRVDEHRELHVEQVAAEGQGDEGQPVEQDADQHGAIGADLGRALSDARQLCRLRTEQRGERHAVHVAARRDRRRVHVAVCVHPQQADVLALRCGEIRSRADRPGAE